MNWQEVHNSSLHLCDFQASIPVEGQYHSENDKNVLSIILSFAIFSPFLLAYKANVFVNSKAIPVKAWKSLEGSRRIRFPDLMTIDAKMVSQMKHQLHATLCRFYFCRVTLHVSGTSAHHQKCLKLVQRPLVHVLSLQVSHHISLLGPSGPNKEM